MSSCSSDPCDEVTCLNSGVCIDGSCDCPTGFIGADCGTLDFDFVGRFSSSVLTISGCNTSTNNGTFTSNADFEYCVTTTQSEQCLRFTLVLEESNQGSFIQVDREEFVDGKLKYYPVINSRDIYYEQRTDHLYS